MDQRFLASSSPVRGIRVFGYRVFGLSLRHVWALELLGSPYARGGEVSPEDAVEAALVLSCRSDEQLAGVLAAGGGLRLGWRRVCGLVRGLIYGRRLSRECAKLSDLFEREMLTPRIMNQGEAKGRKLSSPWLNVLRCRIAAKCGMSLADAWWVRFSDAAWAGITWQELEGAEFHLLTDELMAELEELGWTEEDF